MNTDLIFVVSDYYATGEGRTISILVTRAYPTEDDWDVKPTFEVGPDGKYIFKNGNLKNTKDQIALNEFIDHFDTFYAMGAEVLEKEEFISRYSSFIPQSVLKQTETDSDSGNFHYFSQFHINYS